MDEKKQRFIEETNAYIKKKRITFWVSFSFLLVSFIMIIIGFEFVDGSSGTTVALIGYFVPAVYTLPSTIKFLKESTPEVEPSYDLYINSNGKIYAKEDDFTQGKRAGTALSVLFGLVFAAFIAPVRVFIINLKCGKQIKKAKKQLELVGA